MAKNGQVHEGRKVGRSSATPTKLFSVDFYNLKSMSFTFCNDIFITFEITSVYYPRSFPCLHHLQIASALYWPAFISRKTQFLTFSFSFSKNFLFIYIVGTFLILEITKPISTNQINAFTFQNPMQPIIGFWKVKEFKGSN